MIPGTLPCSQGRMCCVEKLSVCLEVNHKQLEVGFKPRVNSSGRGEGQRARLSVTLSAFLNLRISGFPGGSTGKESACNAGDASSIPGSGRKDRLPTPVLLPGGFHGQRTTGWSFPPVSTNTSWGWYPIGADPTPSWGWGWGWSVGFDNPYAW